MLIIYTWNSLGYNVWTNSCVVYSVLFVSVSIFSLVTCCFDNYSFKMCFEVKHFDATSFGIFVDIVFCLWFAVICQITLIILYKFLILCLESLKRFVLFFGLEMCPRDPCAQSPACIITKKQQDFSSMGHSPWDIFGSLTHPYQALLDYEVNSFHYQLFPLGCPASAWAQKQLGPGNIYLNLWPT